MEVSQFVVYDWTAKEFSFLAFIQQGTAEQDPKCPKFLINNFHGAGSASRVDVACYHRNSCVKKCSLIFNGTEWLLDEPKRAIFLIGKGKKVPGNVYLQAVSLMMEKYPQGFKEKNGSTTEQQDKMSPQK